MTSPIYRLSLNLIALIAATASIASPLRADDGPLEHRVSAIEARSIRGVDPATGSLTLVPKQIRVEYDYNHRWVYNYANVTLECIFKEQLPKFELNRRAYITDMVDSIVLKPSAETWAVGRMLGLQDSDDEEDDDSRDHDGYKLSRPSAHYENPRVKYDYERRRLEITFRPDGVRECRQRPGVDDIFYKLRKLGDENRANWGDPTLAPPAKPARQRAAEDSIRKLGGAQLFPELEPARQPCDNPR